jgi:hypothetical protein
MLNFLKVMEKGMSSAESQSNSSPPGAQTARDPSVEWQQIYRDPQLVGRRLRTHRQKLARLGVFTWPRDMAFSVACKKYIILH